MACGNMLRPHFTGFVQKCLPLYQSVADDTGIGGQSFLVLFHKIVDHAFSEFLFEIKHLKGDANGFCHARGILDGLLAAFSGPHFHGHTNDIIALFFQKIGRYGAVYPTTKAYDHFSFMHILSPHFGNHFPKSSLICPGIAFSLSLLSFFTSFLV